VHDGASASCSGFTTRVTACTGNRKSRVSGLSVKTLTCPLWCRSTHPSNYPIIYPFLLEPPERPPWLYLKWITSPHHSSSSPACDLSLQFQKGPCESLPPPWRALLVRGSELLRVCRECCISWFVYHNDWEWPGKGEKDSDWDLLDYRFGLKENIVIWLLTRLEQTCHIISHPFPTIFFYLILLPSLSPIYFYFLPSTHLNLMEVKVELNVMGFFVSVYQKNTFFLRTL